MCKQLIDGLTKLDMKVPEELFIADHEPISDHVTESVKRCLQTAFN